MAASPSSHPHRRVAVLGGTGFIGRALCRTLVDAGHDVVALARRAPAAPVAGRFRTLDPAHDGITRITEVLAEESVDAVVNAAGGMWGLSQEQLVDANVTLVHRLIDALAAVPGRPRLVQLGSSHEYGLVPIGTWMREDGPADPVMPYGEMKLRCTTAVTEARSAGRIDGLTLRIGNVVGAGQPSVSLLGVVAAELRAAAREHRRAALNLAPLGAQRDFVGLRDTVAAIIAAITVAEVDVPVINIGSGAARPARELVRMLIEASGVPTDLHEAPRGTEPESTWQRLSIDLARARLGWSPALGLTGDLKQLWEYCDPGTAS